ncbi:MAG: hypothetical protein WAZ36_09910 [Sediminibacterium sp.]
MLVILVAFSLIYVFARRVLKVESTVKQVDVVLNTANSHISNFADSGSKKNLNALSDLSPRMALYAFIGILFIAIFPFFKSLIQIPVIVLIVSQLFQLSISWHQHHRKSIKKFFFSDGMILLLLCPTILYILAPADQQVQLIHILKIGHLTLGTENIFIAQGVWALATLLLFYSIIWLCTSPIYYCLFVSISIMSVGIKFIEKYMNPNILDVVVGAIGVLSAILKLKMN